MLNSSKKAGLPAGEACFLLEDVLLTCAGGAQPAQ